MSGRDPLLKIRFEGKAVGAGTIPVPHLLRFLSGMDKALQRTGWVLQGKAGSVRRGQPPKKVKQNLEFDLVQLTHGSPAAVLGFERRQTTMPLSGMDFGLEVLKKAISGLAAVQEIALEEPLPEGCDNGVLKFWRDAGTPFHWGIAKIEFILRRQATPISTVFTPKGFNRIRKRIQGPQTNMRTIEGQLLMADFKERKTRKTCCRVHPSVGDPVLCLFDEEQKEEVLSDLLHYVRVIGETEEDPVSGKIKSIQIHDIERLEESEDESVDLSPQGALFSQNFWESPSAEELAKAQGVKPIKDASDIIGTWPGEIDDGFEELIDELRHPGRKGSDRL